MGVVEIRNSAVRLLKPLPSLSKNAHRQGFHPLSSQREEIILIPIVLKRVNKKLYSFQFDACIFSHQSDSPRRSSARPEVRSRIILVSQVFCTPFSFVTMTFCIGLLSKEPVSCWSSSVINPAKPARLLPMDKINQKHYLTVE